MTVVPTNEAGRLSELRRLGILDTEAEESFDSAATSAALICGASMAVVSFVDEHRQWFKARYGIELRETPRQYAFSRYTILTDEVMMVEDASRDPRFRDNPFVTSDPHIRFYVGAPLVSLQGHALGALCVFDPKPKRLNPFQIDRLKLLARDLTYLLELRVSR